MPIKESQVISLTFIYNWFIKFIMFYEPFHCFLTVNLLN